MECRVENHLTPAVFFIIKKKTKKILNKFYLILNKITADYQINKKITNHPFANCLDSYEEK